MSEIRATTISNLAGTGPATLTGQYAAKVWANLNGTGTIALRDSFNVSSVSDAGTGRYEYSYTAAMLNASYAVQSTAAAAGASVLGSHGVGAPPTTTTVRQVSDNTSATATDANYAHITCTGDLA